MIKTCTPRAVAVSAMLSFVVAATFTVGTASAASPVNSSSVKISASTECNKDVAGLSAQSELDRYLAERGLALHGGCAQGTAVKSTALLVVDSEKASSILRGPLADGENVEIGNDRGQAGADNQIARSEWSPDVQYNRAWLDSAVAMHGDVAGQRRGGEVALVSGRSMPRQKSATAIERGLRIASR